MKDRQQGRVTDKYCAFLQVTCTSSHTRSNQISIRRLLKKDVSFEKSIIDEILEHLFTEGEIHCSGSSLIENSPQSKSSLTSDEVFFIQLGICGQMGGNAIIPYRTPQSESGFSMSIDMVFLYRDSYFVEYYFCGKRAVNVKIYTYNFRPSTMFQEKCSRTSVQNKLIKKFVSRKKDKP